MAKAIVRRRQTAETLPAVDDRQANARRLVDRFLSDGKAATLRAYEGDLRDFAVWLEAPGPAEAVAHLLSLEAGQAHELLYAWRDHLVERLSAATVNRRLSAIRKVMKLGRTLGLCAYRLEVPNVPHESYRDTAGPTLDKIVDAWAELTPAAEAGDGNAARDLAILHLLHNPALRRAEVAGLDVEHYQPERQRLSIHGKGRADREWRTLPEPTMKALDRWLAIRGDDPGPLFTQLDRGAGRRADNRLSTKSIYKMCTAYGFKPHGLRHAGITAVADLSGGDLFKTMAFSRHKSANVVQLYVDNVRDDAGEMGAALGEQAQAALEARQRPPEGN